MPTVYPVPGLFISGVPHVTHECEDDFCTESGAFTTEPPTEADPDGPADAEPTDTKE